HLLEPQRPRPGGGIDEVPGLVDVETGDRLPERPDGVDVEGVDADLEDLTHLGLGTEAESGCDVGDRAGHLDVLEGQPTRVVGDEVDQHPAVADPEVGVVVRLVRGLDDPADELRARAHVGRGEGGAQRPADDPPVLEPGLPGDLFSGRRLHGPTVGPRGPTASGTVASGPPCIFVDSASGSARHHTVLAYRIAFGFCTFEVHAGAVVRRAVSVRLLTSVQGDSRAWSCVSTVAPARGWPAAAPRCSSPPRCSPHRPAALPPSRSASTRST